MVWLWTVAVLGIWWCVGQHPVRSCCAPPAFEVDIKATATTRDDRHGDKQIIQLIYDYSNQRWTLSHTVPRNESRSSKLIVDHKAELKYLINDGGCVSAPLEGSMVAHCVPGSNATHYGDYHYGRDGHQLDFQVWGWHLEHFPVRVMSKVTAENCFPVQDDIFEIRSGKYIFFTENEPCNPWLSPDQVRQGNCYKCFGRYPQEKTGSTVSRHVTHIQYANFFRGQHRRPYFAVPEQCTHTDKWDADKIHLNSIEKYFLLRFGGQV